MEKQPQTFIFFGKSGSGKGTQAQLLIEKIEKEGQKTLYVETGEKFREFIKSKSFTSDLTREVLDHGGLMPVFMPIWIWTAELVERFTGKETLVLDGLCRREDEAVVLDSAMKFYKREKPVVVYINVSDEWAFTRLKERGREDDTEEYLKTRLNWFEWQVKPAMGFFHENENYSFLEINGEQSVDEVHAELMKSIEETK
jgi:adenylate kinase